MASLSSIWCQQHSRAIQSRYIRGNEHTLLLFAAIPIFPFQIRFRHSKLEAVSENMDSLYAHQLQLILPPVVSLKFVLYVTQKDWSPLTFYFVIYSIFSSPLFSQYFFLSILHVHFALFAHVPWRFSIMRKCMCEMSTHILYWFRCSFIFFYIWFDMMW